MGGTEDRAEGKWDQLKGNVKEGAGEVTDDEDLEREGEADQVKGKGKEAWGHVKDAGEDVKEGIKDATD